MVEIRVARETPARSPSSTRVVGVVTDSSGAPVNADRIQLCCFESGPIEALSAPLRPDGSFEFRSVPPGRYMPELRVKTGQKAGVVLRSTVDAGAEYTKLELVSGGAAGQPQPVNAITIEAPKRP